MGTKQTPDIHDFPGMVAVPEKAFFGVLGKLDVHPSVLYGDRHDRVFGCVSTWTLRSGVVIGKHTGGTSLSDDLYMVTESFYASNKAKFENQHPESMQPAPAPPQCDLF